jgi:hypothetical protein
VEHDFIDEWFREVAPDEAALHSHWIGIQCWNLPINMFETKDTEVIHV